MQQPTPDGETAAAVKQDQEFIALFCRHLVGVCFVTRDLGFDGEERGDPHPICAAACAVALNGRLYLVTAGHVIKLIEKIATDPAQRITKATLFNAWARQGKTTQPPLPIDLARMKRYADYNRATGIDFGMILLSDEDARVLLHRGTIPILENQIGVPVGQQVEQFWLLGIPEERQETMPAPGGCGAEIEPNIFRVLKRDNPGCFLDTEQPRMYATVPPQVLLEDLNGMSGVRADRRAVAASWIHDDQSGRAVGQAHGAGLAQAEPFAPRAD